MKPDAIFKCIETYHGKTANKPLVLEKGKEYSRTKVDMSKTGSSFTGVGVFLNDWNNPAGTQLPMMTLDEFAMLEGRYLKESMKV